MQQIITLFVAGVNLDLEGYPFKPLKDLLEGVEDYKVYLLEDLKNLNQDAIPIELLQFIKGEHHDDSILFPPVIEIFERSFCDYAIESLSWWFWALLLNIAVWDLVDRLS